MERTRTTLLLLLGVGLISMPTVAAAAAGAPATAVQDPALSLPTIDIAGETSCASRLKCPCGCSPLAGAWVAKLIPMSAWGKEDTVIQTFKFAPVNDGCTKFVVNSQATTRSAKVAKFWPEACDLTEFVGIACKDEWKDMKFTAIGYGVERCIKPKADAAASDASDDQTKCPTTKDKIRFIAIMTGRIEVPESCLECDPTRGFSLDPKYPSTDDKDPKADDKYVGECKEPKELKAVIYVSYFDAAQDLDGDGFPDCKCEEAVLCVGYETCLKRVELLEPCAESKSFVACLEACKDVATSATGRVFLRIIEEEQKVCFVVTVKDLKDVTKATLRIDGTDVATLFPVPPDTKAKDGDCDGLLSCACFTPKDCLGSWKGRKIADFLKAFDEGKATVVVSTKDHPSGKICGRVEDP